MLKNARPYKISVKKERKNFSSKNIILFMQFVSQLSPFGRQPTSYIADSESNLIEIDFFNQ